MNVIIYEKIKPKIKDNLLSNHNYTEKEMKELYPELKLIRSEHKVKQGYCFNYALKDYSDIHAFPEDKYNYLKDHYKNINLEDIKAGDLVTIHDDIDPNEYNIQHYAKIIKTDNTLKGTIIRSKWGIMGIWQGRIDIIPDSYGNIILFWKKK